MSGFGSMPKPVSPSSKFYLATQTYTRFCIECEWTSDAAWKHCRVRYLLPEDLRYRELRSSLGINWFMYQDALHAVEIHVSGIVEAREEILAGDPPTLTKHHFIYKTPVMMMAPGKGILHGWVETVAKRVSEYVPPPEGIEDIPDVLTSMARSLMSEFEIEFSRQLWESQTFHHLNHYHATASHMSTTPVGAPWIDGLSPEHIV